MVNILFLSKIPSFDKAFIHFGIFFSLIDLELGAEKSTGSRNLASDYARAGDQPYDQYLQDMIELGKEERKPQQSLDWYRAELERVRGGLASGRITRDDLDPLGAQDIDETRQMIREATEAGAAKRIERWLL